MELICKWAPMDVEDALELLGPNFTYQPLRKYAVLRLSQVLRTWTIRVSAEMNFPLPCYPRGSGHDCMQMYAVPLIFFS